MRVCVAAITVVMLFRRCKVGMEISAKQPPMCIVSGTLIFSWIGS